MLRTDFLAADVFTGGYQDASVAAPVGALMGPGRLAVDRAAAESAPKHLHTVVPTVTRNALAFLWLWALLVLSLLGMGDTAWARESGSASGLAVVALSSLPVQAQQTERLIRSGGPFPYQKDGSVFGNRERILPRQPRGHYREYTVATPGSRDRGARRIVCGGAQPREPEVCFYTEDHYASFRRIVQ